MLSLLRHRRAAISPGRGRTNAIRQFAFILTLWLATITLPAPLWACCASTWSCVAAVATQGVTCVIEIAAGTLRILIRRVERERANKAQNFAERMAAADKEAADRLGESQRKADDAVKNLELFLVEARKIVGDDVKPWQLAVQKPAPQPSGTTPTQSAATTRRPGMGAMQSPGAAPGSPPPQNPPPPAYSAALNQAAQRELANDNTLESLRRQIEEERRRGREARERTIAQREKALNAMTESREATKIAFQNSFLGRIDRLLAALQAAFANPLEATKLIDEALGILDGIVSAFDAEVTPAVETDAAVKQAAVAAVQRPADETAKHADRARVILGEMRKSARFKTAVERRQVLTQVSAFLSAPAALQSITSVNLKGAEQLRLVVKKTSADLRLLRPEIQRLLTAPPTPDLRPARAQVAKQFDQYFKGRSPSEARKTREQMIVEARRRYGSDPKIRAAVERLINDEARARGVF